MKNFLQTQKILFTFHFRHFRRHYLISKDYRHFRKFAKKTFCTQTSKIVIKYYYLISNSSYYFYNPKSLLENIYIYLEKINIDLHELPNSSVVQKEINIVSEEMKWLRDKEGIDLL